MVQCVAGWEVSETRGEGPLPQPSEAWAEPTKEPHLPHVIRAIGLTLGFVALLVFDFIVYS